MRTINFSSLRRLRSRCIGRDMREYALLRPATNGAPLQLRSVTASFWKADVDSGTHYEIDRLELKDLQRSRSAVVPIPQPATVNHETAYASLQQILQLPFMIEQQRALQRLRRAFSLGPTEGVKPDLFIKVVPDLDLVLFDGALRHRVHISWNNLPSGSSGSTVLRRGLRIKLRKSCFFTDTSAGLWGTLLHELLHAYLLLVTGGERPKSHGGRHDHAFRTAAREIVRRLGFPGLCVNDVVDGKRDIACVLNGSLNTGRGADVPCDNGILCLRKKCRGYGYSHGDDADGGDGVWS